MDYGFGLALDPFYTFWYISSTHARKEFGSIGSIHEKFEKLAKLGNVRKKFLWMDPIDP